MFFALIILNKTVISLVGQALGITLVMSKIKSLILLTDDKLPSNLQSNKRNWKITRFGHASKGKGNTRINNEI